MQTFWMDRQRTDLKSYEYLCHVGEAQQWVEGCLEEELGFGVTEMDDGLKDGVVLAKLARAFLGPEVVKSIYEVRQARRLHDSRKLADLQEGKHRYKQTENINHFLTFIRSVGMPEVCFAHTRVVLFWLRCRRLCLRRPICTTSATSPKSSSVCMF